jgi:cytoskeletal protein CcmA (bactofilin family)
MNRPVDPRTDMRPENSAASSNSNTNGTSPSGNPSAALRNPDGSPRQALRATPPAAAVRRVVDMPNTPSMRRPAADGPRFNAGSGEGRRMVVAKDITLAGQISKCDYLVVEGGVEGMRYDGQALEVAEGGSFNGSIEVDSAEIAGSFDGIVVVRGRLTVRPTGRITGTVRYGEIEINAGGQVNGELQGMQPAARPAVTSSYGLNDDDADTTAERLAGE